MTASSWIPVLYCNGTGHIFHGQQVPGFLYSTAMVPGIDCHCQQVPGIMHATAMVLGIDFTDSKFLDPCTFTFMVPGIDCHQQHINGFLYSTVVVPGIDCGTGGEIYPRKAWVLSLWPSSSVYLKLIKSVFYYVYLLDLKIQNYKT